MGLLFGLAILLVAILIVKLILEALELDPKTRRSVMLIVALVAIIVLLGMLFGAIPTIGGPPHWGRWGCP